MTVLPQERQLRRSRSIHCPDISPSKGRNSSLAKNILNTMSVPRNQTVEIQLVRERESFEWEWERERESNTLRRFERKPRRNCLSGSNRLHSEYYTYNLAQQHKTGSHFDTRSRAEQDSEY